MAVFQSKYRELSFYVDGRKHKFSNGEFATDDAEVIAVLTKVRDVVCVDETVTSEDKPEVTVDEPEPQTEVVTEVTEVVAKPATSRKTTAKASAK